MKAKVRGAQKDIKIDIKIENNLLSKNKFKTSDEEKKTKLKRPIETSGSAPAPNTNMTRLLSEYYGVMAQKNLYRQAEPSPFNIQQYFTPITGPVPQNQAMIGNGSGQPIYYLPSTAPNSQQQQQQNDDDDDDYEDNYLNNTNMDQPEDEAGAEAEGEPEAGGEPGGEEEAGEEEDEEEQPSTQPPQPPAPGPQIITKKMLEDSIMDDPNQETAFVQSQSDAWQARRLEVIDLIKGNGYLKQSDILKYKLGRYVQLFAKKKWKRIINQAPQA